MKIENKCFHLRQNIKEAADILKDVVREDGKKEKRELMIGSGIVCYGMAGNFGLEDRKGYSIKCRA